ncbi:MAG: copper chaperone PCu(A)C [Ramlibacter sp.]
MQALRNASWLAALVLALAAALPALGHVSLEEPRAETGGAYQGVLRIGHGCDGAATQAVTLQIPQGFRGAKPLPKAGWVATMEGQAITWNATGKESMLPSAQRGDFGLTGTAPAAAGPLWFKVLQVCEQGRLEWSEIPAQGTATAGMKAPAVLLEVMSARDLAQARLLPRVEGAWVRSTVPGQQGTGAFMKLTARESVQLVGVSTPVAGTSEVHEMKMEGDVMRMRAVHRVDLAPGQPFELKPGGFHLMLQDLRQPLLAGGTVPLTLLFRDAKGVESKLELKVPIAAQGPGAAAGTPSGGHKH